VYKTNNEKAAGIPLLRSGKGEKSEERPRTGAEQMANYATRYWGN